MTYKTIGKFIVLYPKQNLFMVMYLYINFPPFTSDFHRPGAKVTEYLLEKSRIVTHAPEERNYHVFYELLAGLPEDQRLKYGLMSAEKYFYLNQGGSCTIDGKLDREDFQSLLSAMQVKIEFHSKRNI